MAYKAKFLHFKTKQSYNTERNKTSEGSDERKIFDAYLSFIDEGPTICTWGKEYSGTDYASVVVDITDTDNFASVDLYNKISDAYDSKKNIFIIYNSTICPTSAIVKEGTKITALGEFTLTDGISGVIRYIIGIEIEADGSGQASVSQYGSGSNPPKIAGTANSGSSINYSREDHVHPAQTSVTGNAGTATKLQTARTISLTGDVTGSASFDGSQNASITATVGNDSHTHSNSTITSLDASKITSGTLNADRLPEIPLEKLPAGALERLVIVANQAARYQLTTSDVQEGDTVKQEDTGVMYFVVDTSNLANENGYKVYTAGAATSVYWSGVLDTPKTLAGYEIRDAYISGNKITLGSNSIDVVSEIPSATSSQIGAIRVGYSDSESSIAVKTTPSNDAYVNITKTAIEKALDYTPANSEEVGSVQNFEWTNGTAEGPTGKLTGTNTDVSFPAIPAASEEQSGIITTTTQTFQGDKTFSGNITVASVCNSYTLESYEVFSTQAHLSQIENNDGSTTPIYIGSGGEHSISYDGSEYTGNAATATKVKNKLTFTGAVTGEYDGSSALTINVPEGGSGGEVPIALPNPYPIKFTGAVTASYDGSNATTVNIPKTTMTYMSYIYSNTNVGDNTGNGITPNYVYYPSSWSSTSTSTFTIYVRANAFNANTPDAVVIVKGTRQVNLMSFTAVYGWLVKQSNILTTGSASNAYRVYAFSYLGGSGSSTRVAVNCSEYTE